MGWYAAADNTVRSKGTMYFVLHPHGQQVFGRWVGLSYDGKIISGWGGIGHTEETARDVITKLSTGDVDLGI